MHVSISLMAHPDREEHAEALYNKLLNDDWDNVSIVYDNGGGEWSTGERALKRNSGGDWHLVIQDDAIIGHNFYKNVLNAIENVPQDTLISFYTGTSRPFKGAVEAAVNKAERENASWLSSKTLMWGVGIAVNTKLINPILEKAKYSSLPYDQRIGNYFAQTRQKVYYTIPSIVDHNDDIGSLLNHNRGERRVAHIYSDDLIEYNKKVVEI